MPEHIHIQMSSSVNATFDIIGTHRSVSLNKIGSVQVTILCTACPCLQLTFAHPGFIFATIQVCQGTVNTGESLGSSWDPPGQQGRHWQPIPSYPRQEQCSQGHGTAPARGTGHLRGDGLRLGRDVSPWVTVRIKSNEDKWSQTCPECASRAMGMRKVHTC